MAQDYDYDWKGQLENLESDTIKTVGKPDNSEHRNGIDPRETDKFAAGSTGQQQVEASSSSQRSVKISTSQDERQASDGDKSDIQGIDIDATIDEAVELEEQSRSKEKQRKRGQGSKGEVQVEEKQ